MRQHRTARNPRTAPIAVALLSGGLVGVPAQVASAACDCSCESFEQFVAAMKDHSGGGGSAEMTEVAACYGECMPQWQQCQAQIAAEQRAAEAEAEEKPATREQDREPYARLGEPRDDLERFYGEYRNPDIGWIVRPAEASFEMLDATGGEEIPPGYVMVYATRGDVAPYYLRAVADTRFESGRSGAVEFEIDANGEATAMTMRGDHYERVSSSYQQDGESEPQAAAQSQAPDGAQPDLQDDEKKDEDSVTDEVADKVGDALGSIFD